MQYLWLNQNNENKKIIVFFNGWGMNETPVKHLKCDDFDILILFDYRNFEFNFSQFDFTKYNEKYLIGWSMGVYVSNLFKKEFNNFNKKIAINGTKKIIDDNFGIPKRIYQITVKLFNENSCEKFIKNMFSNEMINPNIKITKTIEELKEELITIQNLELKEEIDFDLAIISNDDKIIPTKNQINFWANKTKIKELNASHYPFENYEKWSDILC